MLNGIHTYREKESERESEIVVFVGESYPAVDLAAARAQRSAPPAGRGLRDSYYASVLEWNVLLNKS